VKKSAPNRYGEKMRSGDSNYGIENLITPNRKQKIYELEKQLEEEKRRQEALRRRREERELKTQ
jgi:hypothetical protein